MADLTQDAPLRFWGENVETELWGVDSSTAQTIYKGQPVIIDIGTDTLFGTPWVDGITAVATDIFLGIAAEGFVQASGAVEGAEKIMLYVNGTILGFKSAVFTDADVGDAVRMSDSGTLSGTVADNPQIGVLHRVLDGFAYVQIVSPYILVGA
jgi:hypothetical protein